MKAWVALAALLACGCAGMSRNKEPPPKPFAATKWLLVMDLPPPGEAPYVRFGDGRVEGFGGCSRFTGRYLQDAVGARAIGIGRLEVDRRLCDVSVRAAEARMLEVLQMVSSYSVTGDVLTMSGSAGTLRFRADAGAAPSVAAPSAPAPAPGATLAGTRWRGVVESGVQESNVPWLEFVEGRVAGYTGCNMLSGTWHAEGAAFRIGPLATTKRACAGDGNDVERRVLSALGRVTREGDRLVAAGASGERFEFSAVR